MSEKPPAMRDAFLDRIWRAMAYDDRLFFVTADFGSPVLDKIRQDFPGRFVNVGIAEQNLINVCAGLALEDFKVFGYAIAPFITMRCCEQIRVNLALLSQVRPMSVSLIGVGAGYSYVVSGPTHQCYEDLALMRAIPVVRVLSPADHVAAASMFDQCVRGPGLRYLRFDAQVLPVVYEKAAPNIDLGFHVHRRGKTLCLIATGYMLHTALKVAQRLETLGHDVGVIDLFDLSGFSAASLREALLGYEGIVSMEEGFRGRGGMDAALFDFLARSELNKRMLNLGVAGAYRFELGSRTELHELVGIGPEAVLRAVCDFANEVAA